MDWKDAMGLLGHNRRRNLAALAVGWTLLVMSLVMVGVTAWTS